jgi:hypothetical protein
MSARQRPAAPLTLDHVRYARAAVAYDCAADPSNAQAMAGAFGVAPYDEAAVLRDLGPEAALAWRAVAAARLAFFRACGVLP